MDFVVHVRDAHAPPAIDCATIALVWTDPPVPERTLERIRKLELGWPSLGAWGGIPLEIGYGDRSQAQIAQAILAHTLPGQIVADPYCGTGTTGWVALGLGRRFYGCDTDPRMVARTLARLMFGRDPEQELAASG